MKLIAPVVATPSVIEQKSAEAIVLSNQWNEYLRKGRTSAKEESMQSQRRRSL